MEIIGGEFPANVSKPAKKADISGAIPIKFYKLDQI